MSYITVDELRVASPCTSAVWSDEKGDGLSRLCKTCDKKVHNLSLMTLDEANDLIREKEGNLCIALYHGFDGKVLTADSPLALRGLRRKYLKTRAKAIGLAFAIWGFISGTTSSCSTTVGLPAIPDNFTADVNGIPRGSHLISGVNDTTVNEIWINASFSDGTVLWIFIDSTERTPDTYKNHHGVFEAGGYRANGNDYLWSDGELKIISLSSSQVSGTFWFNANRTSPDADTVVVTNGTFDVPIYYGKIPR
ncbi:MAG: hypothetical protein ABI778_01235 [Ignavibacteriota bacterium]